LCSIHHLITSPPLVQHMTMIRTTSMALLLCTAPTAFSFLGSPLPRGVVAPPVLSAVGDAQC
jgi:hypothetical protein